MPLTLMKEIVDDTSGAAAIEYGLIVALIVLALLASLQGVAGETITMWENVEARSADAMNN
jgi:pilus assembly protein Flp/PilA